MRIWTRTEGVGRDIVFVHGWGMDHRDEARTYEPVFAHLPGWCRHYLDLPGMGNTPASPDLSDLDSLLNVLLEGIEALTGGRRFLLAGTSAGAYLARGLLRHVSDRVDGLLLRAPLIIPDDAARDLDPIRPVLAAPEVIAAVPVSAREALGEILVQTPTYVRALLEQIREAVEPAAASADHRFLDAIRQDKERYRLSVDPDAPDILFQGPSLVITGKHDAVVGFRDAWRLMQKLPRCTFVTLDRAEHGLPVDQQDVFKALVRDWLARVEEMGSSDVRSNPMTRTACCTAKDGLA